ncbi:MAG: alpha/beta hydrolase [Campylobacteraceae bacterium]|jgi:predicted alpha/beta hydrolase family esterase|nr:alpha/beta hydrolase [Campylobacteraceae bacterium]
MKKVLIIHGWGGSDFPHWQAKLAQELVLENYIVAFPSLPNRDTPVFEEWKEAITRIHNTLKPDIVICHSIGCIAYLRVEKISEKLFLVAPPSPWKPIKELKSFYPLTKFINAAQQCFLITSDNDKYLSNDEALKLSLLLKAKHTILRNAGHINILSGFGSCDFIKNELI